MKLLSPFSEQALKDPDTYQKLIDLLADENPVLRQMAELHLYSEMKVLLPAEALKIDYDPLWDVAKQKEAVDKWKKVIPPGKIPSRVSK